MTKYVCRFCGNIVDESEAVIREDYDSETGEYETEYICPCPHCGAKMRGIEHALEIIPIGGSKVPLKQKEITEY